MRGGSSAAWVNLRAPNPWQCNLWGKKGVEVEGEGENWL